VTSLSIPDSSERILLRELTHRINNELAFSRANRAVAIRLFRGARQRKVAPAGTRSQPAREPLEALLGTAVERESRNITTHSRDVS
jgi:two-component sensor histidine kinase